MELEIRAGIEEARKVMGMRCVGTKYECGRVLIVLRSDRGSWSAGVRIRRVRAASIGARTSADRAVAAVAIMTVAAGNVDPNIVESDILVEAVRVMSFSAMPRRAAKKLRKNVSKVRRRTL